jgi:4-methylaminobutanoate oxidase (formaldehyde-forming)
MDLWHMDIKRFGASYRSPDFTLKRISENYEAYYDIHYPGEERQSARPGKKSPAYDWHAANSAVFGEKSSWERVNYYANHESDDKLKPYGWAGKHWSSAVAAEHRATRENAGLFDESSFAKAIVSGAQAPDFLNWVCANDVVKGVGRTVYTQALNTRGGIESDYTVTQTGETEFFIITGTAFSTHDFGWLEKQKREGNFNDVTIKVVTEELACFALMGPKARTILAKSTDYDLSHANFPFMHSREINIAGTKVRATRLTYVGELGWEIYAPVADGKKVWEALIAAGAGEGLMPCGYRAIESLRLEKGYRAWAGEINTETNPIEAGLGFAISKKKEKFIGKDALANAKQTRKLVAMTFDDIRQVPLGNEPVRINGSVVGRVKSGGQGYTINKAIGYAYLPTEHTTPGTTVDVEFFGTWATGVICAEPLFDPENSKIRL